MDAAKMQTPGCGDLAIADTKTNSTAIIADNGDSIKKHEATVTAQCALAEVVMTPSFDDRGRRTYIVSRWNLTKELPDLVAVESWLARVTGKPGAGSTYPGGARE